MKMRHLVIHTLLLSISSFLYAHTDISIFDGRDDSNKWYKATIANECAKTLKSEPCHVFVVPSTWLMYARRFNNKKEAYDFCAKYRLYDTHTGLLYVRHINAPDVGIKYEKFTRIYKPFNTHALKKDGTHSWAHKFCTLFDHHTWHEYHKRTGLKKYIYLNGHGSKRATRPSCEFIAGIRSSHCAQLLRFFNNTLEIDLLGIQSCYWTAERVLNLAHKEAHLKNIRFSIVSPLSKERLLWLENYPYKWCACKGCSKKPFFFAALKQIIPTFSGILTHDAKKVLSTISPLSLKPNKGQKGSFIRAGSEKAVPIK